MRKIETVFAYLSLVSLLFVQGFTKKMYKTPEGHKEISVVPRPAKMVTGMGQFVIGKKTRIQINSHRPKVRQLASRFAKSLRNSTGYTIPLVIGNGKQGDSSSIHLILDKKLPDMRKGEYLLNVQRKHIEIKANNPEGIFYGVQTLKQLLPNQIVENFKSSTISWSVPVVYIKDHPRFQWRGMHLDVARHFFSVESVKRFIDLMAMYKFNRLHFHLTDDEGWRLQIKQYPKLTSEGAWRTLDNRVDSLILQQGITNPNFYLPKEHIRKVNGKREYGGYYTQQQMRELIDYAQKRFITIVPEIDMPGHMQAAIAVYPWLSCTNKAGRGDVFSVPLCPGKKRTYTFLENVLDEVMILFPSSYIHIGADEVDRTTWKKSEACQKLMKKEGLKNVEQLQGYFVQRMATYITSKGKKIIGWDDILEGSEGRLPNNATMMYFRSWLPSHLTEAADDGIHIIMNPNSYTYFDYSQDDRSLKHVYSFQPLPDTLTHKDYKKLKKYVIGAQADLWSEKISTPERLEHMAIPRMIALSEVVWSPKNRKNWQNFKKRMEPQYNRLDLLGVNYRQPGLDDFLSDQVFVKQATVSFDKPRKEMNLRYTLDGSEPNQSSKLYNGPFTLYKTTTVKVKPYLPDGKEGNLYIAHYKKVNYQPAKFISNSKVPGLNAYYYKGKFSTLKSMRDSNPRQVRKVTGFTISNFGLQNNPGGLKFVGLIEIPKDGIYTFSTSSDDGSQLFINNQMVVNNGGGHAIRERSGEIALKKGLHPIELLYFNTGGGAGLNVKMKGTNMSEREIFDNRLFFKKN